MTPALLARVQKIVLAALVVAIIGLAMADLRVLMSPPGDAVQTKAAPTTPRLASLYPLMEPPAIAPAQHKSHSAILERPLFDASRRPPPSVTAKPAPPPPKPVLAKFPADRFRLVGIMRSTGNPPKALVRVNVNDPGLWIGEGGQVGGWHVDRVGDDKVDLSEDGATGTLKLVAVQAPPEVPSTAATATVAATANTASAPQPKAATAAMVKK